MTDEVWTAWRNDTRLLRAMFGVPCPECVSKLPRAQPSVLLPQQICRIHKHRDSRPALTNDDRRKAGCEFMEETK